MTDRELAACPCCGKPARFSDEYQNADGEWVVECSECNLLSWTVEDWNRRTPAGEDARDGERYRFIRSRASATPVEFAAVEDAAWAAMHGLSHNFDLNIDAAMEKERDVG